MKTKISIRTLAFATIATVNLFANQIVFAEGTEDPNESRYLLCNIGEKKNLADEGIEVAKKAEVQDGLFKPGQKGARIDYDSTRVADFHVNLELCVKCQETKTSDGATVLVDLLRTTIKHKNGTESFNGSFLLSDTVTINYLTVNDTTVSTICVAKAKLSNNQ